MDRLSRLAAIHHKVCVRGGTHVRACVSGPPFNPGTRLIYEQTLLVLRRHLRPEVWTTCASASHRIASSDSSFVCIYRLDGSLWSSLVSLTRRDRHSRMPGWPLLECVNCSSSLKGRWHHRQCSQSSTIWFIKPQSVLQCVTWSERQHVKGLGTARRSLQAKGQVTRNVWCSGIDRPFVDVQRKDTVLSLRELFPAPPNVNWNANQ